MEKVPETGQWSEGSGFVWGSTMEPLAQLKEGVWGFVEGIKRSVSSCSAFGWVHGRPYALAQVRGFGVWDEMMGMMSEA